MVRMGIVGLGFMGMIPIVYQVDRVLNRIIS